MRMNAHLSCLAADFRAGGRQIVLGEELPEAEQPDPDAWMEGEDEEGEMEMEMDEMEVECSSPVYAPGSPALPPGCRWERTSPELEEWE